MKHTARLLLVPAALLVASVAVSAEAQYFDPSRRSDGYLPDSRPQSSYARMSPIVDETAGPPDVRFGIGLDFGAAFPRLPSLDDSLFRPNDAETLGNYPAFAFDANGFVEVVQTARVGFLGGMRVGGHNEATGFQSFFGLGIDVGHVWPYGWAFFAGGGVGVGMFYAESENDRDEYYEYDSRGPWLRGHVRVERQLTPYVALRLTGLYEHTFIRNETVTIDVPADAPVPVKGKPSGDIDDFGILFGVVFTTF